LFNRRILSPAVLTPQLTPTAPADTDNRARTLESEHESRLLKLSLQARLENGLTGQLGELSRRADGGGPAEIIEMQGTSWCL
jgi:hypothetical protein